VVVAQSADEAVAAVRQLSALGAAGRTLVLEELMEGEEVSVIALCDGERFALLPPAQDHKRIFDGDQGPNTGGMGAYCPAPFLDRAGAEQVGRTVIAPTLRELSGRGYPFRGALYAGLMLTSRGVKVVEFNCRFGDPETQVQLLQLDEDLLPLLAACAQGQLHASSVRWAPGAAIGVVLAARGYPGTPAASDEIHGVRFADNGATGAPLPGVTGDAVVFHAGTKVEAGKLVTAGGRVLTVCARGGSLQQARERAYAEVERIRFQGVQYRRDIGARALRE
jgi:phosphoribosylamine--glycine ligase